MTKRKAIGWLVFSVLMLVFVVQVPRVAGYTFYLAGLRFCAAGKYEAAVNSFQKAVFFSPGAARAYIELGSSYLALEKYRDAEKAFLKARSLRDESCASCGLGMAYHGLHRYDDAEKLFQRAMTLNSNDACAYEQSGRMYYDLDKYPEAIAAFKRAIELRPNFGNYMYLGNSYVYAQEFQPGVNAYKEAIRLEPDRAFGHVQLGVAYDYLDRQQDAVEEYKQALKLDPENEKAHYCLAQVYVKLGYRSAAKTEYQLVRKINPDYVTDSFEDFALSSQRKKGQEKLYFIPLNDFSTSEMKKLVAYYKQKTGIDAITTEPLPLRLAAIDNRRQQQIAEQIVDLMKRTFPKLVADPNAVLIALTDEDMYIRDKDWQFAFSYRTQGRFAVVSSARMNPLNLGVAPDEDLLNRRMRKMISKTIGLLYYQLPESSDPKSVLYDNVKGLKDLDNMGEDF